MIVSGAVRLADKYLLEEFRKFLIQQVTSDWPKNLSEWDKFRTEIDMLSAERTELDPLRDHIPEPVSAINFAREFGCAEILPAAFYLLSTISPCHNDWSREPVQPRRPLAKWSMLQKNDWHLWATWTLSGALKRISPPDLLQPPCIPMYYMHGKALPESTPCYNFINRLLEQTQTSTTDPHDVLRQLASIMKFCDGPEVLGSWELLCPECTLALLHGIKGRRVEIWEKLLGHVQA